MSPRCEIRDGWAPLVTSIDHEVTCHWTPSGGSSRRARDRWGARCAVGRVRVGGYPAWLRGVGAPGSHRDGTDFEHRDHGPCDGEPAELVRGARYRAASVHRTPRARANPDRFTADVGADVFQRPDERYGWRRTWPGRAGRGWRRGSVGSWRRWAHALPLSGSGRGGFRRTRPRRSCRCGRRR